MWFDYDLAELFITLTFLYLREDINFLIVSCIMIKNCLIMMEIKL